MKKALLLLLLPLLSIAAVAQSSPTVVVTENIHSYDGAETYVFNKADGKIYVRNNLNEYEVYGLYEKTTNLAVKQIATETEIEYIATDADHLAYINTGYIHKANTRIVADVEITAHNRGWEAVFGARQNGYGNQAFVLFSRAWDNNKGCFNRSGKEEAFSADIPLNERIIIDANGLNATITKKSDNSQIASVTSTGNADGGTNTMFIFDTNTAGAGGATRDNSSSKMKLYSFKIYEGETLVHDYVPVITELSKGGLKDKIDNITLTSADDNIDFLLSSDGEAIRAANAGVTVYNGKMVCKTDNMTTYKYNGTGFVSVGAYSLTSIDGTEYKNMKNWRCPDDHWNSVFGGGNEIKWDASTEANTFDPYVGTGGWEPLHYTLNLQANEEYNVSFKYSTNGWDSWSSFTTLPFKVLDRDSYDQNNGNYDDPGMIAYIKLPKTLCSNVEYDTDFITTTGNARFIVQFGVVDDGEKGFTFGFANFNVKKYTYPESYPVLNPFGPEIEDLLPEVEAFDKTTTTDAIAALLDAAVTTARSSLDDPDNLAAQKEALENLQEKYALAQAANVTTLRATIAYVKAKGVDASAQEDYLVNGTTNDVQNQINAAVIALKQEVAEKSTQPTIFTMVSESVVGTDDNIRGTIVTNHADGFYVYNVGTGRWFCGGDDWGAHAAVGFPGIKITTPEDNYGSGQYNKVKTWLFNGDWNAGGLLANNGYCDTDGNAWKFWQKDADHGIYTWSNNGDNTGNNDSNGQGTKDLVGFTSSTYMRVDVHQTDADNPYNQWIFVTEAQRDQMAAAAMPSASEANPVDLTYKIKMPGFNQRERKEEENQSSDVLDWTCNHANYRYNASDNGSRLLLMGRGENHADFVCDVYGDSWNDAFSWTQTVTGLTPGSYRVKVQGYNNGGSDANKACLVANGQKVALVERSSESVLPWTTKLPENTFDNPEYFQVGLYWNEVLCNVGGNGELTLGVESPSITGSHVVIFDNFRLEYIGLAGVEVGSANYTTFVAPYNIASIPEGVEAYACQVNTNSVHLERVYAIPEDEAVVLKNTGTYKFSPSASAVELGVDNDLKASDGTVTGAVGNIYALAKKGNPAAVGFYLVGSSVTVPAGKGYLQIGSGSGVKAFYGFDDDDATGINEELRIKNEESTSIFNVAGQRMSKKQKGINIVNGKKILK